MSVAEIEQVQANYDEDEHDSISPVKLDAMFFSATEEPVQL